MCSCYAHCSTRSGASGKKGWFANPEQVIDKSRSWTWKPKSRPHCTSGARARCGCEHHIKAGRWGGVRKPRVVTPSFPTLPTSARCPFQLPAPPAPARCVLCPGLREAAELSCCGMASPTRKSCFASLHVRAG